MDAALFYQLLMGELNVTAGNPGAGYGYLLNAARQTSDPALFTRVIDIALRNRAGNSALSAAQDWASAEPQSLNAQRAQLQILLALDRPADTPEPLQRVLSQSPAETVDNLIRALPAAYARVSNKAEALRVVRQVLQVRLGLTRSKQHAAAAWSTIGRMENAQDNNAAALDAVKRGVAADATSPLPIELALLLMQRRVDGAEDSVQQYLNRKDTDGSAMRLNYARVLLDLMRFKEARQQLELATQNAPERTRNPGPEPAPEVWLLLGNVQLDDRQAALAEKTLETYLQRAERSATSPPQNQLNRAFFLLSRAAQQQKKGADALRWLNQIESDDPQVVLEVQLKRASVMAQQGLLEQALDLIRKAPEDTDNAEREKLWAEADVMRDAGQYPAAYEVYNQVLELFPGDAETLYEQSTVAEKMGRPEEMERLLRQLIKLKPDFHHAYNALGYALADRNQRLPEAKTLIQKALSFEPNDPYIQDSLGWVEFRLGNANEALRILQQAYNLRSDAEIAAHLGEVLWSQNQRQQALSVWRQALQREPANETLQTTLKRLNVQP